MRQQMLYGNKQLHQKHESAGVHLQVRQLRHLPHLGGDDLVEIVIVEVAARTWTQKRETRQQCGSRCSAVIIIASEVLGGAGFAYSSVSSVSIPSSVGMEPLR